MESCSRALCPFVVDFVVGPLDILGLSHYMLKSNPNWPKDGGDQMLLCSMACCPSPLAPTGIAS